MSIQGKTDGQEIKRKKYSSQFKDQALERIAKDGVPQVAKDLGLPQAMLYSWRSRRQQGGNSIENQKLQHAEFPRLYANTQKNPKE